MIRKYIVFLIAGLLAQVLFAVRCPKCSRELGPDANACKFCGKSLLPAPGPAVPPDAKPVVIKPVVIKPVVIKPVDDKPAITQPVDRPVTIYDRSSATSWANGSRADSVGAEMRVTPFRLGVADAFALPSPKDLDVCGLNLSLFAGSSRSVYGVTGAGVLDETGKLYGIGFGMFSVCDELYGVQCALFVNYARKAAYGLQIGMVNQAPATSKVVQIGLFNMIDRSGFWKNRAIPILNMQF